VPLLTRRLHLSKGQLVDVEGGLQTRQWDDDAVWAKWKKEDHLGLAAETFADAAGNQR
jgi:hypothetical protein